MSNFASKHAFPNKKWLRTLLILGAVCLGYVSSVFSSDNEQVEHSGEKLNRQRTLGFFSERSSVDASNISSTSSADKFKYHSSHTKPKKARVKRWFTFRKKKYSAATDVSSRSENSFTKGESSTDSLKSLTDDNINRVVKSRLRRCNSMRVRGDRTSMHIHTSGRGRTLKSDALPYEKEFSQNRLSLSSFRSTASHSLHQILEYSPKEEKTTIPTKGSPQQSKIEALVTDKEIDSLAFKPTDRLAQLTIQASVNPYGFEILSQDNPYSLASFNQSTVSQSQKNHPSSFTSIRMQTITINSDSKVSFKFFIQLIKKHIESYLHSAESVVDTNITYLADVYSFIIESKNADLFQKVTAANFYQELQHFALTPSSQAQWESLDQFIEAASAYENYECFMRTITSNELPTGHQELHSIMFDLVDVLSENSETVFLHNKTNCHVPFYKFNARPLKNYLGWLIIQFLTSQNRADDLKECADTQWIILVLLSSIFIGNTKPFIGESGPPRRNGLTPITLMPTAPESH